MVQIIETKFDRMTLRPILNPIQTWNFDFFTIQDDRRPLF